MRWQYKRVNLDIGDVPGTSFQDRLDELGEEGWELVATLQHERHGYSHEVHLVFKRPALDDDGTVRSRELGEPRHAS
jgi:hypothetical protein